MQWRPGLDLVELRRILGHGLAEHGCNGHPGCHGIDTNTLGRPFTGQGSRQVIDSRLANTVGNART